MTLKYRYIGKGTTDSNGIAHMTEDADGQTVTGYTGTGKGLTDIIASTDDSTKISDSSIVSETYELYDCLAYNKETSASDFYTYWDDSIHSANTITVNDSGTLIETDASAFSFTYMQIWLKAIPTYIDAPICCEIEVVEDSTNYVLCHHMVQNDDSVIWSSTNMTQGKWKLNITNNKLEVYKNGVLQRQQNTNTKQVRLYLQSTRANGNSRIKFKNHRLYPI